MGAFVEKDSGEWEYIESDEKILNTDRRCVFADNIDDAVDYINTHLNPYGDNFIYAFKRTYYNSKRSEIGVCRGKKLKKMSFFQGLEILKKSAGRLSRHRRQGCSRHQEPARETGAGFFDTRCGAAFQYGQKR